MSTSTKEAFNWTSKDEEAIQEIKQRLGRLQTLAVLKVLQEQEKNNKGTFTPKEKPQEELTPIQGPGDYTLEESPTKRAPGPTSRSSCLRRKRYEGPTCVCHLKFLVDQVKGNRVPRTEGSKRYREEIMDATTPFHRFRITYLPKALNPKAEALTGLASTRLGFLNQEVSVGVKTRPSVEAQDKLPKKARNIQNKEASGKSSLTWEDRSMGN
ncbi:hypothetical protein Tco_0531586 [Tanacetum coccineum]